MKNAMFWFAFALYAVLGFGSLWIANRVVHDNAWLELIYEIAWLPCGIAAFMIKVVIEQRLLCWVDDGKPETRRDP